MHTRSVSYTFSRTFEVLFCIQKLGPLFSTSEPSNMFRISLPHVKLTMIALLCFLEVSMMQRLNPTQSTNILILQVCNASVRNISDPHVHKALKNGTLDDEQLERRDDADRNYYVPIYKAENCWPEGFPGGSVDHIITGVGYLSQIAGEPEMGPGCGRISCSGDAGIWWCNEVINWFLVLILPFPFLLLLPLTHFQIVDRPAVARSSTRMQQ